MEVMAIEKVGRHYRLQLDNETIHVSPTMMQEWPLHVGDLIDGKAYKIFLIKAQYKPCLEFAVALLSARAYAEKEMETKLLRAGYYPKTVELVMVKLQQSKLLDDTDFAQMYTRSRVENHVGRYKIAQELRRKGVDRETIQETLHEISHEDQLEGAKALIERQLQSVRKNEDPRKTAQKLTGMLVRRGYSFDLAREALQIVQKELSDSLDNDEDLD